MIEVAPTEITGMLLLALVVLRAAWLALHPAAHHAALQPAHWASRVDRTLHTSRHRA